MTQALSYDGRFMTLRGDPGGVYTLMLDNPSARQNTLSQAALAELADILEQLAAQQGLQGLVIRSAKSDFIAGADVTEFYGLFQQDKDSITSALMNMHEIFNALEELPCPTLALIRGAALGGGLELALACDFRLAAAGSQLGLPEVKLGIHPGWGGCVRLPRLIGLDNALEWLSSGRSYSAEQAHRAGVIDGVLADAQEETLDSAARDLLARAEEFDLLARRAQKALPLQLSAQEQMLSFTAARALIAAKAGRHYPAPLQMLEAVQRSAVLAREPALETEAMSLAELAHHPVTAALVGVFLKEQSVKSQAKKWVGEIQADTQLAVLGAGVMGAGIAAQGILKGAQVTLRDINGPAVLAGQARIQQQLMQSVERGRLTMQQAAKAQQALLTSLHIEDCAQASLVIEAVSEDPAIKLEVLQSCEAQLADDAVLCTNTSTLSINRLAAKLSRPENFCGLHFFNPVARMPLVEIIRGDKTSAQTIARAVAQAQALGKTPVVVNDCAGFLVNRVLFPYLLAFDRLVAAGADPYQLDHLMQQWGWPMGPGRLLDQIGMDIACHAGAVMANAYPQRMQTAENSSIARLYQSGQLGIKTGTGFYLYPQGQAVADEKLAGRLGCEHFSAVEEAAVPALMLPMAAEAWRCLEEGIVDNPAAADLALIYGLGFPPFRGGIFSWLDSLSAEQFSELVSQVPEFSIPDSLLAFKEAGELFYPQARGGV